MPLTVGEIHFGQIDAKNEVFQQDRQGINVFRNSFQIPPGINVDELIAGSKFFIAGQKAVERPRFFFILKSVLIQWEQILRFCFLRVGFRKKNDNK